MEYDDERIDALVRAMRRDEREIAARIPAEVVHAYLTGRATAAQKSEIRRALSVSPRFRAELVDLANYLGTLSSDTAAHAYERAEAPPFSAPEATVRPVAGGATTSFWTQLVVMLRERLRMPRLGLAVPALGVAVLVVTVLPQVTWSPLLTPTETTTIDAERFAVVPGQPRGAGERDPELAALRAIHECVRARDGGLEAIAPAHVAGERIATVHVVNAWRRKQQTLLLVRDTDAPRPDAPSNPAAAGGSEVQVWVMALPETAPAAASISAFTLPAGGSMAWKPDTATERRGVLVATYASGGLYFASRCIAFGHDTR